MSLWICENKERSESDASANVRKFQINEAPALPGYWSNPIWPETIYSPAAILMYWRSKAVPVVLGEPPTSKTPARSELAV